jgi:NAD(P)-dependent dehydrogenase (short-subunit alcohol dehydrogenase family)
MPGPQSAWIITGPTSGIGRQTALRLAAHGTVILVGRNAERLAAVQREIEQRNGHAIPIVCDLSDMTSVERAAAEITALELPIAGLVNNAGMVTASSAPTAQGWDPMFAANHLGPFHFTETLAPHLPDDARVVFVCSAVEDPERTPAVKAGYRGGRYISAAASAEGRWTPGGSTHDGYDAYATAKQALLASVFAFARQMPRLRFTAVEPGFNPTTGFVREAPAAVRFVLRFVLGPLAPFIKYWSTPARAGAVISEIVTSGERDTGVYYDENGDPMRSSRLVRDPAFQERVIAETRALLSSAS